MFPSSLRFHSTFSFQFVILLPLLYIFLHSPPYFSNFAVVSLCGVTGLAETFPSFPVSGPFLPDVPGFHVHPDRIFPPQLRSSSMALPLHLHFDNAWIFSVSDLLLTCPNHSSIPLLITTAIGSTFASSKISSFLRCSNSLTPIAHRTIPISVIAIRFSSLTDNVTLAMFRSLKDPLTVKPLFLIIFQVYNIIPAHLQSLG